MEGPSAARWLIVSAQRLLGTLLDTPTEVHAVELGVVGGVVVALLVRAGYRRVGLGYLAGLVAFALGLGRGAVLCRAPVAGCLNRPVQGEPWYFGTGLVAAVLLGLAVGRRLPGPADRPTGEPEREG